MRESPVRITPLLGGPDQFDRMRPGHVLVAKITTPA
jgi:hypothetical protein